MDHTDPTGQNRSRPLLLGFGLPIVLCGALFGARIIWEETSLTLRQGPQMIGFSPAHIYPWAYLAPIALLLWILVAVIIATVGLARRRRTSRPTWIVLSCAVLVMTLISLPPVFWQWAFIGKFASSPHAGDLMTYAAAEGDARTVRAYLNHGVPVEAINYEGSTATFAAAAGGSTPVLELLATRGANLNATNSYGDSPLAAAVGNNHIEAAAFLRAHGAKAIEGTPEQRNAASKAIVEKDIERLRH